MLLPLLPVKGCCRQCGRDVPGLDYEYRCEDCRVNRPHFDRAASVFRFEEEARRLVLDLKFRRHIWLRDDLVDLLEGMAHARFLINEIGLVLPVPATKFNRIDRGGNHCAELAVALARRLNVAYCGHCLKRVGKFARQGGLDERKRRTNVLGTFAVTWWGKRALKKLPKSAPVLVVDDIMTTGSTLSEVARTLKEAGVEHVWCLTLARSIRV